MHYCIGSQTKVLQPFCNFDVIFEISNPKNAIFKKIDCSILKYERPKNIQA